MGHGLLQKISNTTLFAEDTYFPFSAENKIFCLNLHYNIDNSYLYINGQQVTHFKAKDSEINKHPLAFGNITDILDLSDDDIENNKLYGYIYDFSVDYNAIKNDEIINIHNYLTNKTILYKWFNTFHQIKSL